MPLVWIDDLTDRIKRNLNAKPCPCGKGIDTDGDGDCPSCAQAGIRQET